MKEALAYIAIAILAAFALVNIAKADRLVNINLVVVEHPTAASVDDQIRLFKEGLPRLAEVGVKPRIIKIDVVPDFYNVNKLDDFLLRLYTWSEYGKKQRFKGIVFYSLPPMISKTGGQFAAGHAGAICIFTRNKNKKFAEGSLRVKSALGFDRQPQSRVIVLHELLHLFGANHIESKTVVISKNPLKRDFQQVPNVMHPNAQAYATMPNLPLLSATKRQVRYCKQGKNVLGERL